MMEKAGYLQRTGCKALDNEGILHEVLELHVYGIRYAIRSFDLVKAISGGTYVQMEELAHNWNYYLGTTSGLAQVSASGKALNIEVFGAGNVTVSLHALRAVVYGKERCAVIVKIPEQPGCKVRRVFEGQQKISATV